MFNISNYLSKFTKNLDSNDIIKSAIVDVVFTVTNIKLQVEDIEVKNNIILVKNGTQIKNKLFIFKDKILLEVNKLTELNLIDIR